MVRFLGGLVGLFFSGMLLLSFLWGAVAYVAEPPAETAEKWVASQNPLKHEHWSFNGPFGHYDRAQLQRGFQVYTEVCAACHSLKHVAFRDLEGLGYNEAEVKAIAKNWKFKAVETDAKSGDKIERANTPSDKFPLVYYPGQGVPPDLSLIAKARHGGADYLYSLLTGYTAEQPAELLKRFPDSKTPVGLYYNPYFANLNLAMPAPITTEGQVTYGEGQPKPTVDQMSRDVSAFLMWTAEPKMEARKSTGLAVLVFLLFATVLAYLSYRNIWAGKAH